jgi:tripartite-type tricarboxylate transporter receptor subunit TctC
MGISSLRAAVLLISVVFAATSAVSRAQPAYPARTVKIVVPLPPGPAADVLPRVLAERLSVRWRQPVIVENRPGAALTLGAEAVAKAEPDGHTLLATPPTPLVISQHFNPKLAFDPAAFVPISIFAETPYVLVANPKVSASTLQELIALAKANPDKLSFASAGIGSGPHLTVEMLRLAASIRMVHVPYTGLGPALTDLLGGHIDLMVDNLGNALPLIAEGRLKVLAIANDARIPELPNVPAMAEMFPAVYSTSWLALVAPPKTPADIAMKISESVAETVRHPNVAKRFRDLTFKPIGNSPAEAAGFLRQESDRWRSIIAAGGIKPK